MFLISLRKNFVSAKNVSPFARLRKHHEQQCVRNNVSSFATDSLLPGLVYLGQKVAPAAILDPNVKS